MSVSISINVAGLEEFAQAINRFDSAMKRQVQAQLQSWAEKVKADAERMVPVRTGYLQSTIFARSQEWQMKVGAEAAYASAVEFGTQYARAQPYLSPAVQVNLTGLETLMSEAVNSAKAEAEV